MKELYKQLTILIVDDAKENINILTELLKSDFKIRAATNGEKALEIAFSENPPDLILLDVLMPKMDGYEVCKKLKASPKTKNIPIIFVTGKASEEDEIHGLDLGAFDYITKPFKPVIIKARIHTQMELKRYHDYLEGISNMDGLTGIPNRRKFNEFLDTMWGLAIRKATPISMLLIDIDFFKRFNDTYGHLNGDMCLIQIAQTLYEADVRKTDLVARYGGEEFACILPNTKINDAVELAEKLRISIENLQIPHSDSTAGNIVSISIGVATITPKLNSSYNELIKAADEALYKSKESGRNKVSF